MQNKNPIISFLWGVVFCLLCTSCQKDDAIEESKKLSLLYWEDARMVWNGTTANYFVDIYQSENPDTIIDIQLGLYRNHKDPIQETTVEVEIDTDSLSSAIALSENNSNYSLFKKARLLPPQYYTYPTSISLSTGQEMSQGTIVIHKEELLKDAHTVLQGGIYVIPLKMSNPTKYSINENVNFVMYILRFPDNQLDPTKPDPSNPPETIGEYSLFWHDEFNGAGAPNPDNWTSEIGFVRNQELQWYLPDNAECGNGVLTITGKKERIENVSYIEGSSDWRTNRRFAEYTSTSLTTLDKMHFKFGRIEIRAKIPTQKGAWPAIWTLGENMEWPSCGEIDILEYYLRDGEPHIHANFAWGKDARWDAVWNSHSIPFSYFLEKDPDWALKFHTWVMVWEEDKTYIYLDDELIREVWTNSMWNGAYGNWTNPFHQPHYVILNLALGSNGGDPSESNFPMKYEIDYVRVYQKK